jgi:hypothetical protein
MLDMGRRHKVVADSQGRPDTWDNQHMHNLGGRDTVDMSVRDTVPVALVALVAPVVLHMAWMAERLSVALEGLTLAVRTHSLAEHRAGMADRVGMVDTRVRHLFHVLDAKNLQGDCSDQVFVMVALIDQIALTDLVAPIVPIALVCVLALAGKLPRADEYPLLVVPMILPIAQMLDADVFDWGRMLTLYIQNSR